MSVYDIILLWPTFPRPKFKFAVDFLLQYIYSVPKVIFLQAAEFSG